MRVILMTFPFLRGRAISERSLELNVLGEALEYIRRSLGKAYIVGYTTRQEALHGLDVSINAPGVIISAYQFKAPSSGHGDIYRFRIGDRCWICSNPRLGSRRQPRREINGLLQKLGLPDTCINQHTILYAVATVLETTLNTPVYYAFPLIRDYTELEQRTPGIINYTVLIRVRDMPIRTVLDCKPHKVEVTLPANNPSNITVTIHSRPEKTPQHKYAIMSKVLDELAKREIQPKTMQAVHLDPENLQQILEKELSEKASQENLEPELIERVKLLIKAITMTSFSYRGTALTVKRGKKH